MPPTTFANKVSFSNVRAIRESASALLVKIVGDEIWIPQSQIDDDSEVYAKGHTGKLVVSQWIAEQRNLV